MAYGLSPMAQHAKSEENAICHNAISYMPTMLSRLKPTVFIVCLIPLGQLAYNAWMNDLTANPIEFITHFTGDWALIFLLATLTVTPVRKILGWNEIIKFRRMLGLFAFFYAVLHFSTYMVLDHFFDFQAIAKDIVKRPYVTAGFTAFVLMIPLAITSTAAMIRRLGKRWQLLHRLVYIAAIAGVIHFYWLVKADIRRPLQYGTILALLLGSRLVITGAQRSQRFQKFQLFHLFQSWLKKPRTASRSSTFRTTR